MTLKNETLKDFERQWMVERQQTLLRIIKNETQQRLRKTMNDWKTTNIERQQTSKDSKTTNIERQWMIERQQTLLRILKNETLLRIKHMKSSNTLKNKTHEVFKHSKVLFVGRLRMVERYWALLRISDS